MRGKGTGASPETGTSGHARIALARCFVEPPPLAAVLREGHRLARWQFEWQRQEGIGCGDAARLRVRGILRGVQAQGERRRPTRRTARLLRRQGRTVREREARNPANLKTGSGMQQARERRCGESRRGGAKPRGRNGSGRWEPAARRHGARSGPGVDASAERRWRGDLVNLERQERRRLRTSRGAPAGQ